MGEGSATGASRRVLLGTFAFLFAFIALTAVVTHHGFDGVDAMVRAVVHRVSYPLVRPSMEAVSFLGGRYGQIAVICLASVLLWPRQRPSAVALPVVMAGAGLLQHVAKWAVDRPRPNLDPWGFPSGHVLTVVVLFGILAYLVGGMAKGRRSVGVALWAAIVGAVGFSRMYLDAHWFSDVLGGFAIGLAYLLAVIWLIESVPARRKAPPAVA